MTDCPRILVELEVEPDDRWGGVPGDRRLAQMLKAAGRRLGLRCTSVKSTLPLHVDIDGSESAQEPASAPRHTADRVSPGKVA